jgi:ubiquinone/menaquinone biosynthesis C-methylase UbiE
MKSDSIRSGGDVIQERSDYKNWMPKGMVRGTLAGTLVCLVLFIILGCTGLFSGVAKTVLFVVFLIATIVCVCVTIWMALMYRAFDYNGKRKMSKQIIEGIAEYVRLPDGGKCLDVGCGSGALTIACAKRNPNASFVGIDRWGKEYASFNKPLCERNAKAENVNNVSFRQGDATKLDFADGTFDAVTSNYVYHNIPSEDRQAILLETLRTLKKGGTFALHDIFSKSKYGDMQTFVKKLKDMGYEKVDLIDTTSGIFMTPFEAKWMALSGSALLVGRK